MILESAKFKSTIKNPSIWAIGQLCMMKIAGSAIVFLLLGALVPWSPVTQADYLSFQWWKWAGGKNLRKNRWFRTTFVFYSILKSYVWIGTWSQGHLVHRRHNLAFGGQNELGKNLRKNLRSWTTFVFYSILKSQIVIDLMTAIHSCDKAVVWSMFGVKWISGVLHFTLCIYFYWKTNQLELNSIMSSPELTKKRKGCPWEWIEN